jgi:hypothetical protein
MKVTNKAESEPRILFVMFVLTNARAPLEQSERRQAAALGREAVQHRRGNRRTACGPAQVLIARSAALINHAAR